MATIIGFGGTVSLNFNAGGASTFPVRNISVSFERDSLDVTILSDFRMKRAPGRFRRTATFEMLAQDSSTDNALRTHLYPTTLADTLNRSVVLVFTDQGSPGISYTLTGHLTGASRTDDGSGPGVWSLSMDEA
jgi:hypothetical protein